MSSEQQQLEAGMAALEAQRALLGDAVVDAALGGLRAKLAALNGSAVEDGQTLKQVSILFLDVAGSTLLAQHLDPEEISSVMDGTLARCSKVVETHQGKVLQYAGDSLLAAFGAGEAREDDAERAVRCGLALLAVSRVLGTEIQAAHGHAGFKLRVGIHTGSVLLGGGVDGAGTIRGMAVNIAARMEQSAPAGALRISHDTYAQVRGMFEVQAQEPLVVKGVDTPVQSYLVQRTKPRSFHIVTRGIEGVATRMIGREAEFAVLQDAFKRLFSERRLVAVAVVAEAGIGKSRLLYEFQAWTEEQPEPFFIFRGRATAQTQGQPFGLLRDILAWRFQIADDDTIPVARAKLEAGIVPLFVHDDGADLAEGHAHLLGHLIGIEYRDSRHIKGILDDPRQIRNRAFHAAAQLLRRVSASDGSPVVLQLEDLHWADNETLDFLSYAAVVNRDVPMLILGLTRPTLFERRTDFKGAEGFQHQRIDLKPLDKTDSRLLADELLKKLPEVPSALRELVTGTAEGNPFYMEELVKMLIDQGAIQTGAQHWSLHADKLLATRVPATLTGVLQARLDGLPPAEKLTLQEASVIGAVFWDQALIALDEQARDTLPALVQRELTLPRAGSAIDGLREYAFRHQILHQVTYATVLKRTRRALHRKLAEWFAMQTGLRTNDFLGITAEHYEQAGDETNAAEYHARAAEHAKTRFAHDAALGHVQRGLALLAKQAPSTTSRSLRWRLLDVRERTLDLQSRRVEQLADSEAMQLLADEMDDDRHRAYVAVRRADIASRTADWPAGERAARLALTLSERAGAAELRLRAMRQLAIALARQGELEEANALARAALAEAGSMQLSAVESLCLNALTIIAGAQGDPIGALDFSHRSLEISRRTNNRRDEVVYFSNVGFFSLTLGDFVQAERDLEEALRLARANGDRMSECPPLRNLSRLALWQGNAARALHLAQSALETAVAAQARDWEAYALLGLGEAELAHGRHAAAAAAYEQCRAKAQAIGNPARHNATAGLARVAQARGDASAAMQHLDQLLGDLRAGATLDGEHEPRHIELICHQVLAAAGDPRAGEWLERAHTNLQATAATITDATLRQRFLANIPAHREIVAGWSARLQAPSAASGGG